MRGQPSGARALILTLGLFVWPTFTAAQDLTKAVEAFERRDYKLARTLAEGPAMRGDADANALLALVSYFYGRYAETERFIAKAGADRPEMQLLDFMLENPFSSTKKTEGFSKKRTYYLVSDLGQGDVAGMRELSDLMERVHAAFQRMFRFKRDAKLVSRVIVFAERTGYMNWAKRLDPGGNLHLAAAFYDPNTHTLVIGTGSKKEGDRYISKEMEGTIIHEAFHQFVNYYLDECPYWFNEGMAEYFGAAQVDRKKKKIPLGSIDPRRLDVIQRAIEAEKYTPLADLLTLRAEPFMRDASLHYAQSWSLCHYLIHGHRKGKKAIEKYFEFLMQDKDRHECFDMLFGGTDFAKLEVKWKEYVMSLRPEGVQLNKSEKGTTSKSGKQQSRTKSKNKSQSRRG